MIRTESDKADRDGNEQLINLNEEEYCMTKAFKEWALIVDALGSGRQNLILRKGGIAEEDGSFALKASKFLLLPTRFHQSNEQIKDSWRPFLNAEKYQVDQYHIKIEYFAEVADSRVITDWDMLKKLDRYHAWTEDVIRERFDRWEKSVHMIVVQVFSLLKPVTIEMLPEYNGCKSWIELGQDIELVGKPILNPGIH